MFERVIRSVMVSWVAVAAFACGEHAHDAGDAKVSVAVSAVTAADVEEVSISVTAPDIVTPVTSTLSHVGATWQGTVLDIPAGVDRRFHAEAMDSAGVVLFEGDAEHVAIVAGMTASVILVLHETAPPDPFHNAAPYVTAFWLSSDHVEPSTTVILGAQAYDPDGEPLTYAWTAPAGTFSASAATDTNWNAPATDGSYPLSFTATDPHAASDSLTATVVVETTASDTTGDADVNVTFNIAPLVSNITSTAGRLVAGGPDVIVTALASDADGDALTYAWNVDCPGTLDVTGPSAASAITFVLDGSANAVSCTFTVAVTDARGAETTGTLTLAVDLAPTAGIVPQGLVAWWPGNGSLADVVSGRTLRASGNVTYASGVHGQGFLFTAGDGRLAADSLGLPAGAADRTVELWARIDVPGAGEDTFATYGELGSVDHYFIVGSSAQLFFSQWGQAIFAPAFAAGTWHHLAVTISSGTQRLYVDGSLVASGMLTVDTRTGPGRDFVLGAADSFRNLIGAIDEVRVYDRALDSTELTRIAAGHLF